MPSSKGVIVDKDDEGHTTREGLGGAGSPQDIASHTDPGAMGVNPITGQVGQRDSVGAVHQGQIAGHQGTGTAGGLSGHFIFVDPFLKRMVPRYNAMQTRHVFAKGKALKPLQQQRAVLQGLRDKFSGQTGFWNTVEGYLSDPISLIALAGAAVSGGAATGIAAQRALQGWSKEQGAEDAVKRLDKALAALDRQFAVKSHRMGTYREFSVAGLSLDIATLDPAKIPKGVIYHDTGAYKVHGLTGTGPLPSDFVDWFKRKHKPLGKLLTPHIGKL